MPADSLLHPLALGAVLLLVLNDHVFKSVWPGVVTGKLSDFAGLAFFPLVPLGCWELAMAAAGLWRGPRRRPLLVAAVATGVAFWLVKTTAAGAYCFGWLLSFGQWVPAAIAGSISSQPAHMGAPATVARDVTDLIALPALLVAVYVGLHRRHVAEPESLANDRLDEPSG
jgi:hypothetical protein